MKRRAGWSTAAAVIALLLIALLTGCNSTPTVTAKASVGPSNDQASVSLTTHGGSAEVLLLVSNPQGGPVRGSHTSISPATGYNWHAGQLPSGTYTYTVYWIAAEGLGNAPDSRIMGEGQKLTGQFAVPPNSVIPD
jgi:hypothetical protein